jgi:hypothetical protein
MKFAEKYEFVLIVLNLALSIPICLFYVSLTDENGLVNVPLFLWVIVLIYSILQFVNKQLNSEIPSSVSLLYYIGLLSIGLPVFLLSRFEKVDWLLVAQMGCWFLLFSVLWQMRLHVQRKNNQK